MSTQTLAPAKDTPRKNTTARRGSSKAAAPTKPEPARDELESELMEKHFPLVRSVVNSMMSYLPACADVEELHSAGTMGLISAVKRYEPG